MKNDFVIRPALNHKGHFIEISAHQKDKMVKRVRNEKISSIIETNERKLEFDEYHLRNLTFKAPTGDGRYRIVMVELFVCEKFMDGMPDETEELKAAKENTILKYINNASPWVFSYAWRSEEYLQRG